MLTVYMEKMLKNKKTAVVIAVLISLLLSSCAGMPGINRKSAEPKGKAYFSYFDTVSYVYSYAGDPEKKFDERCAAVSDILGEYHELFDIYHEYSGKVNLCTVNKNAGGEPLKVDDKLIAFLLRAKELYTLTDGEMNVMLGSVLKIWHDCRETAENDPADAFVPEVSELAEAAEHADISLLEINEEESTVRISDPDASIDVGAIGKGYAAEMAAMYLEQIGAESYVLNVGGNIRIVGTRPDGSGWNTAVRDPGGDGTAALELVLADTACVTSGNYERFYVYEGRKYHHIIDKDTLFPAEGLDSVTIITRDSCLADALSTAVFCMPYEEGSALIESLTGTEAVWMLPGGEIRMSSGAEDLIRTVN